MANTTGEFKFRLLDVPQIIIPSNVRVQKANKNAWPVLSGITIVRVEIPKRKMRAPHLHTNANELSVIVEGSALAVLLKPNGERIEVPLKANDCVFFPQGWVHWVINKGKGTLVSYFNYSHEQPVTQEVAGILLP